MIVSYFLSKSKTTIKMHLEIKGYELRLQFRFDLSQQSILNLPRRS